MTYIRHAWLAALIIVALTPAYGAAEEALPLRRLAVIPDGTLRASPLVELLAVRLSGRDDVELVEREALDEITAELKLSQVTSTSAANERLRLGKLIGADAMVFLSHVVGGEQDFVRLVVSDSRNGARLRVEHVVYDKEAVEQTTAAVAEALVKTLVRFRGGLREVVGVAPFVSKNFLHDYDHLGRSLAHLLQNKLSTIPGVAVIEVEEALAISRELAVQSRDVRRHVPLLVDVAFVVHDTGIAAEREIELTVQSRRAGERQPDAFTVMIPLDEAAGYVTEQLPRKVLDVEAAADAADVSLEDQAAWLISQADAFSQLGAWKEATGLREAALLLDPTPTQEHLKAILEYRKIYDVVGLDYRAKMDYIKKPDQRRMITDVAGLKPVLDRIAAWHAAQPHLEYLVRNGKIDRGLAMEHGFRLSTMKLSIGVVFESLSPGIKVHLKRELAGCERVELRALNEVYPLMLGLSNRETSGAERFRTAGNAGIRDQSYGRMLAERLIDALVIRRDRDYHTPQDLEDIYRTMMNVVGKNLLTVTQTRRELFQRYLRHGGKQPAPDAITYEQWIHFLRSLRDSPYPVPQAHGHYGLLQSLRTETEAEKAEMVAAARATLQWAKDFERRMIERKKPWEMYGTPRFLSSQAQRVAGRLGVKIGEPRVPNPPRPMDDKPPPTYIRNRLRFEPVKLKLLGNDGGPETKAGGFYVYRLTSDKDLDAYWKRQGTVFLSSTPDTAREAVHEPESWIDDVKIDGKWVWVGTRGQGLRVFDRDSQLVRAIGVEEGLPPCDARIMMHGVSPGVVIATGSFGPQKRAWIARVSLANRDARPEIKVFHEATRVSLADQAFKRPQGADMVFLAHYMHECDAVGDGRRILYIYRGSPGEGDFSIKPLAVDLETLKVEAVEDRRSNGMQVTVTTAAAWNWTRNTIRYFELHRSHWEPLRAGEGKRPHLCTGHPYFYRFHVHDGWIYQPGIWMRANVATWEYEFLTDGPLPQEKRLYFYGVSAHHGFVGWGGVGGTIFRILVEDEAKAPSAAEPQSPVE